MILVEALVAGLILIGSFFLFVGSLGLARLPDMMRRLHAPTKSTTLGVGATLIGSMIYFLAFAGDPSIHELMITLFLFLTAPVTGQMIAKAHILRSQKTQEDLPPSGSKVGWATLDAADDQAEAG
jgi:multicomponent K+:H+ antiporter subunit G